MDDSEFAVGFNQGFNETERKLSMGDAQQTTVGFNEGFSEKDAANLQAVKDAIVKKALEGDTAAAGAFAQLLDAETRRHELSVKAAEKMGDHVAALNTLASVVAPPGAGGRTSWREAVTAERQPGAAVSAAAA
jgi:hypothetical protein